MTGDRATGTEALRSISVRELVPFSDPSRSERSAQSVHRVYQARLARKHKSFRAEQTFSAVVDYAGDGVNVTGRVDGIRKTRRGWILTEIKPVDSLDISDVDSDLERAKWQLQIYADLIRLSGAVPVTSELSLELVLLTSSAKARALSVEFDSSFGYLQNRLAAFRTAEQTSISWPPELLNASDQLELRDRPLQIEAWSALSESSSQFTLLALPPGAGKTRLALRWAMHKASESSSQIIWITAKARGRETVLAELAEFEKLGTSLRVLWKTTRERLCSNCNSSAVCETASHTRRNSFFGIGQEGSTVCNYEKMRHEESAAHLIVADLNYILSPSSLWNKRAVFVIDEAQHWAARSREQSEWWFTRTDLKRFTQTFSTRERAHFAPILQPVGEESPPSSLWSLFMQRLARRSTSPNQKIVAQQASVSGQQGWYIQAGDATENMLAGLQNAQSVLALSGSLPAGTMARSTIFPPAETFSTVEPSTNAPVDIRFVPMFDFRHPLTLDDHRLARDALLEISSATHGSIFVLGQSRESNAILFSLLTSSGSSCIMMDDVGEEWQTLTHIRPDFVFASVGSSSTESLNPPPDLFAMVVVLSAGMRPATVLDELRSEWSRQQAIESPSFNAQVVEAASNIIQAIGRLNRSPEQQRPALILNRRLLEFPFIDLWPDSWRVASAQYAVYDDLQAALTQRTVESYA